MALTSSSFQVGAQPFSSLDVHAPLPGSPCPSLCHARLPADFVPTQAKAAVFTI
jgi:hypothetical protein